MVVQFFFFLEKTHFYHCINCWLVTYLNQKLEAASDQYLLQFAPTHTSYRCFFTKWITELQHIFQTEMKYESLCSSKWCCFEMDQWFKDERLRSHNIREWLYVGGVCVCVCVCVWIVDYMHSSSAVHHVLSHETLNSNLVFFMMVRGCFRLQRSVIWLTDKTVNMQKALLRFMKTSCLA